MPNTFALLRNNLVVVLSIGGLALAVAVGKVANPPHPSEKCKDIWDFIVQELKPPAP
jgi:hypothetical protein